jgi:YspA, cpYpsA-related SLOG family
VIERVLICGDRNWNDYGTILRELSKVQQSSKVEVVIEGEANGADSFGRAAATVLGIPVLAFPADWRKHGRAAGPIRNRQMLNEGNPTLVLAFHNFIENSKGTKDMVNVARNAGVPVRIIKDDAHTPKENQ